MERNGVIITLNTFGGNERIYAVNFYPDWYIIIHVQMNPVTLLHHA